MGLSSPKKVVTLDGLSEGQGGVIEGFDLPEDVLLKLMEMGMGKGRNIRYIRRAPMGDPLEVEILHYRLAIRRSEARGVKVRLGAREGSGKSRARHRMRRRKGKTGA